MGWWKKLKKKAKKINLSKIGKELTKGITAKKVAEFLPAPVGKIVKTADSIGKKAKKLKKKAKGLSSALSSSEASEPIQAGEDSSTHLVHSAMTPRQQKKMIRMKKRIAKKKARRDGYLKYNM